MKANKHFSIISLTILLICSLFLFACSEPNTESDSMADSSSTTTAETTAIETTSASAMVKKEKTSEKETTTVQPTEQITHADIETEEVEYYADYDDSYYAEDDYEKDADDESDYNDEQEYDEIDDFDYNADDNYDYHPEDPVTDNNIDSAVSDGRAVFIENHKDKASYFFDSFYYCEYFVAHSPEEFTSLMASYGLGRCENENRTSPEEPLYLDYYLSAYDFGESWYDESSLVVVIMNSPTPNARPNVTSSACSDGNLVFTYVWDEPEIDSDAIGTWVLLFAVDKGNNINNVYIY